MALRPYPWPFEALSLRAEREKEPNLDAVVPREDGRDGEGGRGDLHMDGRGKTPKWMVKIMENPMNKWMIWECFTIIFCSTPMLSRNGYT